MHRNIGRKPSQVTDTNERLIMERRKKNTARKNDVTERENAGDGGRISKHEITFAKG